MKRRELLQRIRELGAVFVREGGERSVNS